MTKRNAPKRGAGTATPAPAAIAAPPVHTSAQAGPPWPRDEYTGLGGRYIRDPATGQRTRVPPEAQAPGTDTAAA